MPRTAWLLTDLMIRYQMLTPSCLLEFSPVVNNCNFGNISKSLSNKHKRGWDSLWLLLSFQIPVRSVVGLQVVCACRGVFYNFPLPNTETWQNILSSEPPICFLPLLSHLGILPASKPPSLALPTTTSLHPAGLKYISPRLASHSARSQEMASFCQSPNRDSDCYV